MSPLAPPGLLPRVRPATAGEPAPGVENATRSRWPLLLGALVAVLGIGWRVVDVHQWPFPYATTVQYESALAARAIWVTVDPSARTPERLAWFDAVRFRNVISPPVLPGLVAACYAVTGEEIPWVSKVVAAGFWVGAGWLLLAAIARQTGSRWAGLVAAAWFVFCPFGLVVSRSFQTESVMVCGLALAVWRLSGPGAAAGLRAAAVSGLVCGLAAFAKPGILLPPLAAGFAGLLLSSGMPGGRWAKAVRLAVFVGLLALPSVAYAAGAYAKRGSELRPQLLADPGFYAAVWGCVRDVVGRWPLALGLAGAGLAAARGAYLQLGLLAGYVGYVGIFTYHCATHNYYHTPLLVLVAVGLGWVAHGLGRVGAALGLVRGRVGVREAALALACLGWYVWFSRLPYLGPWRCSGVVRSVTADLDAKAQARADAYRAAAAAIGPGGRVIALTEDYGLPFEYVTSLPTMPWPIRYDAAAGFEDPTAAADSRLGDRVALGFEFFVVTDVAEFEAQPALRAALDRRGKPILVTPAVRVYDLRPRHADQPGPG